MTEKKEKSGLTVTVESARGLCQVEETLQKFDGTDKTYPVTKWAEDMDDNATIIGWTEAQRLLVARRTLIGAAALWLKSEKMFKTYDELKVALAKEFPDAINVKEMHEIMSSRKKRRDETCYEYMLVMKELGKRGKFADYVAIKRTQFGTCMKLRPKFLGPYKVIGFKGNDRYDVQKADSAAEGPSKTSSAADYMKPWPGFRG